MAAVLAIAFLFALSSLALFTMRGSLGGRIAESRPVSRDFDARPYVAVGFVVRLLMALAIRALDLSDYFAPDRYFYEVGGKALAARWSGESTASIESALARFGTEPNFYHYANGFSYFVVGSPWLILVINCALGALLVLLIVSLVQRLNGDLRAQRFAALMGAAFPSLVVWSSINIRDIWALVAIALAIDAALAVRERLSPTRLFAFGAAMFVLGLLRSYMFVLVSVGLAISVIASLSLNRLRGLVAAGATAAVCAYLYSATGFGSHWVADASLERLSEIREGMLVGAGSAYLPDADISTPWGVALYLPFGLAYFWLAPFPWIVTSFRQALAVPEMLVVYALVPSFIRGAKATLRERFSHAAMLLSVVGVISIAYALIEGNYGTAYRHRAQVMAPVLAFVAIGLAMRSRAPVGASTQVADVGEPRQAT